jgi:RNA polymerase sigma factor for flagellar operon FliA
MLDPAARNKLIEDNLGYAKALAIQVRGELASPQDLEELMAHGARGLVEAAERWDPARGVTFATFAYYRIRGAIFDGMRKGGWLPRELRFAAAANDLLENLGDRERPPDAPRDTIEDQVAELGQALDGLSTVFLTSRSANSRELADAAPAASEQLEEQETLREIRAAVTRLPEKERQLVEAYYYEGQTLEAAGKRFGLSKSWCCRLHARAIQLLGAELGARPTGT